MKITNRELLRLIWLYQLKLTAEKVIIRYVGGTYGVCRDDSFGFVVGISRSERRLITKRISEAQLLTRMKDLIRTKHLQAYGSPLFTTCWVNSEQSNNAFAYARAWWIAKGIPEGFDTDKQCVRTVPCENIEQLTADCTAFLLKTFGDIRIDYSN